MKRNEQPSLKRILVFVSCFLAVLTHEVENANAVDRYLSPETRYQLALKSLRESGKLESRVSARQMFSQLDWVGKTALINLACQDDPTKTLVCQGVLRVGLVDDALVIRDHSLRTLISSNHFKWSVKEKAAKGILGDERNYRRGNELWIVRNAREFLANGPQEGRVTTDH